MHLNITLGPLITLIAGILILIMPRLLNYIVAIYLIIIGLIGIFGAHNLAPLPEFLGANANFVPSGGTLTVSTGTGTPFTLGKNRVECGIHPWMRMIITVKRADSDDKDSDRGDSD